MGKISWPSTRIEQGALAGLELPQNGEMEATFGQALSQSHQRIADSCVILAEFAQSLSRSLKQIG